jgi:Family of unknown function (DUF6492)
MQKIVLYCKSYHRDLNRLLRLARSVAQHNKDQIPFYVSVSADDQPLFLPHARTHGFELIKDEDIIACNPKIHSHQFLSLPGYLQQQIVKAEFWRLNISENYLCIDSDSQFLRDFRCEDFISPEGHPYSTLHEEHSLLEELVARQKTDKLDAYFNEASSVQNELNRAGRVYSFGPTPVVWNHLVWSSLDEHFFSEKNISILDAIVKIPSELRWYGEALLKYQRIPLIPIEPLFKVLHYHWQNVRWLKKSLRSPYFLKIYLGVIYQSNWDASMDWPSERGNFASRWVRHLKQKWF